MFTSLVKDFGDHAIEVPNSSFSFCPSFLAAGLGPPSQEKSICLPREGVDKLLRGGRGGGNHC